jgi:hypothetical protein
MFPVAKDARMAVAVVPIFAPIVMGKTVSTVKMPEATRGIIREVVIELLWMIAVKIKLAIIVRSPYFPITLFKIISALFTIKERISFTIKYKAIKRNTMEIDKRIKG